MSALNSSRLLIAQGLVSLLQGVQNTVTSSNLYLAVKLGSFFDPSAYASGLCADVTFFQGKSGPAGSGGNLVGWRIEDAPVFVITTIADYEADSTLAMTNTLTAMDMLMPLLHSHFQIPNPNAPSLPIASVYSLLEDQVDRARAVRYPNGHVYYVWTTFALCKQQYNVSLSLP
ncbi:MAG: hypothetical protein H0W02_10165 [Ktedonobacteraceae bacterium]|nr:hypothetical protein [Ktedonobacteraceae bacterium]